MFAASDQLDSLRCVASVEQLDSLPSLFLSLLLSYLLPGLTFVTMSICYWVEALSKSCEFQPSLNFSALPRYLSSQPVSQLISVKSAVSLYLQMFDLLITQSRRWLLVEHVAWFVLEWPWLTYLITEEEMWEGESGDGKERSSPIRGGEESLPNNSPFMVTWPHQYFTTQYFSKKVGIEGKNNPAWPGNIPACLLSVKSCKAYGHPSDAEHLHQNAKVEIHFNNTKLNTGVGGKRTTFWEMDEMVDWGSWRFVLYRSKLLAVPFYMMVLFLIDDMRERERTYVYVVRSGRWECQGVAVFLFCTNSIEYSLHVMFVFVDSCEHIVIAFL